MKSTDLQVNQMYHITQTIFPKTSQFAVEGILLRFADLITNSRSIIITLPLMPNIYCARLISVLAFIMSALFTKAAGAQPVRFVTQTFVDFKNLNSNVGVCLPHMKSTVVVDSQDWAGVIRVANDLQKDLKAVTGVAPEIANRVGGIRDSSVVIIGTIGRSPLIDGLVKKGKIKVDDIRGKWESYVVQTVRDPFPGIPTAVVIAGSDKRGSIFGTYELSEQMGVSPWYYWADVPIKQHDIVTVKPGRFVQKSPAVKYRGIFINDEAPCLTNWVLKNFGQYNHEFYGHVFELLLRLKANYLWPAMWNNCFNEDDAKNPEVADMYGIVMGTSHVEPMMRADKEWNRLGFTANQWNYLKSSAELEKFWADGVRRNKPFESITTMAMRGKIDTPMSEDDNIDLLQKIVTAQRKVLAKEVNADVTKVPQLWCLYKEVQNYYDKGMRVPDDITLLWADDNWGNIRRLPTPEERNRVGGAGVYYHFDYVGGPRNYKWLNTSPLPHIWEQMHMAYESKADRIWIVNVGDIKPLEFPTEFFIRMGWDPNKWNANNLDAYTINWATREFGPDHAAEIADLLAKYAKINGRRKPELLDAHTYSQLNYHEADNVVAEYNGLATRSEKLYSVLPADQRDAYFQLVHYPILACANLNDMMVAAGKNALYAKQKRPATNDQANIVQEAFARDAELTKLFHTFNHGKWDHMMDQTHIGYTNWQQPNQNNIPATTRFIVESNPALCLAVEGSEQVWPGSTDTPTIPKILQYSGETPYFDLFNRGAGTIKFTLKYDPFIKLSQFSGQLGPGQEARIFVTSDWSAPTFDAIGTVTVVGDDGTTFLVKAPVRKNGETIPRAFRGHVEGDGCVSIEAVHYARKSETKDTKFVDLPDLGRTGSAVTLFPITAAPLGPTRDKVCLEYPVYFFTKGEIKINAVLSPTQHLKPGKGLRYAISIDDQSPIEVNMHENYVYFTPTWEASVAQNAVIKTTNVTLDKSGAHTIKFWAIDPGVVMQKLIIDTGNLKPSYLGPPESTRVTH
jgi:hypothetical protein